MNVLGQIQQRHQTAKLAEERIGVGLHHEHVQGLQAIGRQQTGGPRRTAGTEDAPIVGEHLDGERPDDLLGGHQADQQSEQIDRRAHADGPPQHVRGRHWRRGFGGQAAAQPGAVAPRPHDGNGRQQQSGAAQQKGRAAALRVVGSSTASRQHRLGKDENDARNGGQNDLRPPGEPRRAPERFGGLSNDGVRLDKGGCADHILGAFIVTFVGEKQ